MPELQSSRAHAFNLVYALTTRELRMRYQGTVLGYIWWIGRPTALGIVLYFAMHRVVQLNIHNYAVFLMSALFPWFWFQSSVSEAAGAVLGNGGLVKKVVFPRIVLPLSSVMYNSVQFALTIPVLIGFVLVTGERPSVTWIFGIPALFVLQVLMHIGIAQLVSSVEVLFRDLAPILDVGLTLAFYVSPVIYPLDRVPERTRRILALNPLAPLLEAWRNLMISGDLPGWEIWPTLAFTALMLAAGTHAFRSLERYFADAI